MSKWMWGFPSAQFLHAGALPATLILLLLFEMARHSGRYPVTPLCFCHAGPGSSHIGDHCPKKIDNVSGKF